jgi:hypothetical protein
MDLHEDWKEFCALLNANKVDYLVVGAFALAFHGLPRLTADVDLWVRPTRENAERLVAALREFGFPLAAAQVEEFAQPNKIWQIGAPPYRIDVLTSISGVEFEDAWISRMPGELGGVPVAFISRDHFIKNKRSAARTKDVQDADRLEEL